MSRDFFQMLDERIQRIAPKGPEDATIVSIHGDGKVRIRLNSGSSLHPAYCPFEVESGQDCLVAWSSGRRQYVVLVAFQGRGSANFRHRREDTIELAPPDNFTVNDDLPGFVLARWDVPHQQAVAFDVYISEDGLDYGTPFLTTRGSYALIPASVETFVRVRSVAKNGEESTWTDWESAEPVPTGKIPVSTANVTSPPTLAEITAAFGTPAAVGAGQMGLIDDNGAGTNHYLVVSDGANWIYVAGTKAI